MTLVSDRDKCRAQGEGRKGGEGCRVSRPRCEARSAIERFECGDRVGKRGNQPGRYDEDDGRGTPSPRMT